jgi:hypothetical protein
MAKGELRQSALMAGEKVASAFGASLKGAVALSQKSAAIKRRRNPALSIKSSQQLFDLFKSSSEQRGKLLTELFKDAESRFKAVLQKYSLRSIGVYFGFADDKAMLEQVRARVMAMKKSNDGSFKEFHSGAIGRENDFIGRVLFEFTIKYGPIRRLIEGLASDGMWTINQDIKRAAKIGKAHVMLDANNRGVKVSKPFSDPLTANAFAIDTVDGAKESLDFGSVGFNPDGQWSIPLPIEIKLPRAAGGVAGQFAEFPTRIAEAIKEGKSVFAYFDAKNAESLRKLIGKAALVGQIEDIDGRQMVKVVLDPSKLVFSGDEIYGPIRNQMVITPGIDAWNPANPTALPQLEPPKKFVLETFGGQPVSLDVAASAKGFNYWRMAFPVKREFLIDVYKAIFSVDS